MPRVLPGLDADQTSQAVKIFNTIMETDASHEKNIGRVRQIFEAWFEYQIDEDGVETILEALPGWTKDIEDFTDPEDQIAKLEALDGEFLELSRTRSWRWVKKDWDHRDLDIWSRLNDGPQGWEQQRGEWKTPVPRKSMKDLLYNSLRIMDGLSQPDKWEEEGNRTGLVLGNIQSGKTASMLAVSSIALDQRIGYKVLIVLGGHTENLRRQTQERFQIFRHTEGRNIHFGTSTREKGDLPNLEKDTPKMRTELRDRVANAAEFLDDGKPIIWVVKKNTASLSGIKAIMKELAKKGYSPPTLILDDESDHSSLNTKPKDKKGSTIHNKICKLRRAIEKNCYVGYTATPQGILMADPESDLFPDNMLWLLEPHGKYIGADHFFNEMSHLMISTIQKEEWPSYGNAELEIEIENERRAGNNVRMKEYQKNALNVWIKNGAPISFKKALIDFVLTGGIRWRRRDFGEKGLPYHALMFHVEREMVGQKMLGAIIDEAWEECREEFLDLISSGFDFEEGNEYHALIKERWERLQSNSEALRPDPKDRPNMNELPEYFNQIINSVGEKGSEGDFIRNGLRIINSVEGSELPYHLDEGDKDRPPKAMILIGGDLLSRGLTVEGLTVSYYLRLAKKPTFDTELQRCRWFGAKKGDEDVLTLWIQRTHQEMFKDLTDHNKDLVKQVRETVLNNLTPIDSIIILHSTDSYQVTGYSKRGARVEKMEDSYSGNSTQFKQPSIEFAEENMNAYDNYLDSLPRRPSIVFGERGKLWEDVDARDIIKLLKSMKHETDRPSQIRPGELGRYLQKWIDVQGTEGIVDFPTINIVQRFGEKRKGDVSSVSERGREMDGADGARVPRASFKNLAAGASGKFSGDWWIDAVSKKSSDMDMSLLENWFVPKPEPAEGKERKGEGRRDFSARRNPGAPILFVFYKLDRTYVNRKNPSGAGKWYLNEDDHSHLIADEDLVGFICSLPIGGPGGGGIVNKLLDRKNAKMIAGRLVDKTVTEEA